MSKNEHKYLCPETMMVQDEVNDDSQFLEVNDDSQFLMEGMSGSTTLLFMDQTEGQNVQFDGTKVLEILSHTSGPSSVPCNLQTAGFINYTI